MKTNIIYFVMFFTFLARGQEKLNIKKETRIEKLTENGVTLWMNQPNSFHYKGKHDRTYYAYTNTKGQVVIRFFDHITELLSPENIIHSFNSPDDHSSPSIIVLKNGSKKGHIAITFSHHSSPLFFSISEKPENIFFFTTPKIILNSRITYPSIIQNTAGQLRIFFRGHPKAIPSSKGLYQNIYSKDFGRNWSNPITIISFNTNEYVYACKPYVDGDEIGLSWSILSIDNKKYINIYISYSLDFGKSWSSQYGFVQTLTKDNSRLLLKGEQIRVVDITKKQNQYLISAVKYENEFSCCNALGKGIILSETGRVITFKTNIDYYASGASFDNFNSDFIY